MDSYLKEFSSVFQETCLPSILNISVSNNSRSESTLFNVIWKQTNFEISKTRKFAVPYKFDEVSGTPISKFPLFPIQYDGGVMEKTSLSKTFKASIKKQENSSSKKEEFVLEIFSAEKIVQTINLSTFDKHGQVLSDPYFSTLEWSPNEEKLLYIAERKKVKNEGFFDRKVKDKKGEEEDKIDNSEKSKKAETTTGEKYNYEETWGELLNDITSTVVVVVDLKEETVEVVKGIPDHVCPAQPCWLSDNAIIFTGYNTNPFRLGLRVCECRPSKIYTINLEEKVTKELFSTDSNKNGDVSDHSARINASKKSMIFIRRQLNDFGNLHRGHEKLMLYDINDDSLKELLEKELLFLHSLPSQCWLSDEVHFVISNDRDGLEFACIVNSKTNKFIKEIPCNGLYGVESNLVFMVQHELDSAKATLKLATLKGDSVVIYQEILQKDESITYGNIKDDHGIVSYYMTPSNSDKPTPLVVYPHGGPHVMASNSYRASAAAFVKLGYSVLLCNYRGSTGFGKENLDALPGNVGDMDVKDVHHFVEMFLEKFKDCVDERNIFVFGGSHGGFIGGHLVGQYPDFYRAAALLNPVTDMSAMMMVTDIPDWTFVESGLPYQQGTIPTPEILSEMVKKSPVSHLKNVKAPVLLLVGGKDMRVPPSQGKSYYRLLKANGKTTKLLYYPEDSHPLLNIETTGDFFVNVLKWFHTHKILI